MVPWQEGEGQGARLGWFFSGLCPFGHVFERGQERPDWVQMAAMRRRRAWALGPPPPPPPVRTPAGGAPTAATGGESLGAPPFSLSPPRRPSPSLNGQQLRTPRPGGGTPGRWPARCESFSQCDGPPLVTLVPSAPALENVRICSPNIPGDPSQPGFLLPSQPDPQAVPKLSPSSAVLHPTRA